MSPSSLRLGFPSELNHRDDMEIYDDDEEFSVSSSEEANKVLKQWQEDQEESEMLDVAEHIGFNLLDEDMFGAPYCLSPTGPLEELALVSIDDDYRFLVSFPDPTDNNKSNETCISSLPFEERYRATLKTLQESMKKSQETRRSLTMRTSKIETYDRINSVGRVLSSIEISSRQLHDYLASIQRQL